MEMNKLKPQFTPGYIPTFLSSVDSDIIPYLKILTFHACVNADELMRPKDPKIKQRLFMALDKVSNDINFPGYRKHVETIGVKNAFRSSSKSLSEHVARAMVENIGNEQMKQTAMALIHTLQSVVKEVENVMGYDVFNKAGLITEYDALKKDLETALATLKQGGKAVTATKTLVFAFQKRKKYHKAIFARLFPPGVLAALQENFGDETLDYVVPKILERFANVPKLKNIKMESPVAMGKPLNTESQVVDSAGAAPKIGTPGQLREEQPLPNVDSASVAV
jgi:hypothetical protein